MAWHGIGGRTRDTYEINRLDEDYLDQEALQSMRPSWNETRAHAADLPMSGAMHPMRKHPEARKARSPNASALR